MALLTFLAKPVSMRVGMAIGTPCETQSFEDAHRGRSAGCFPVA